MPDYSDEHLGNPSQLTALLAGFPAAVEIKLQQACQADFVPDLAL